MEVGQGDRYPLCGACRQVNGGLVSNRHRQVHVRAHGKESCVDEHLTGVIVGLWEVCDTTNSCQDHDGRAYVVPTPDTVADGERFLTGLGLVVDNEDGILLFRLPAAGAAAGRRAGTGSAAARRCRSGRCRCPVACAAPAGAADRVRAAAARRRHHRGHALSAPLLAVGAGDEALADALRQLRAGISELLSDGDPPSGDIWDFALDQTRAARDWLDLAAHSMGGPPGGSARA
jgi:hypothetical protein